jgi:hypothetical protein
MCIATVVDLLGPRLRLRLDGTDDRNDFWLLVDSEFIHPFEYTTKRGGSIQPPLGFRNNISTWPKFFDKLVQSAGENTFARDTCFKPSPAKPVKNEFKKGQKLEAVDQKNPHLLCPATIKDCDKDNLLVSFDGWSQLCNFWCNYTSRDIFPVGWSNLANHPLQLPGNYDEKRKSHRRSGGNTAKTPIATAIPTTLTPNSNSSFSKQSNKNSDNVENNVLNASKSEETVVFNEKSPLKQQNNNNLNKNQQQTNGIVDLSLVKTESIDNFDSFTTTNNNKKDSNSEHAKNRDTEPQQNNVNTQKGKF